jgi:hypothetical protein
VQSVSAELASAITAPAGERPRALVRLRVDWNRSGSYTDLAVKDLSADVVSVDLARDLTTDLPAQAKLFAGAAAAEATITLATRDPAGDPAKHAAWKYSPLNSASPIYSYKRKGAPAILEFGFNTTAGDQYVTVLTGMVRSLDVVSGGRVAVLRVIDRSETMRRQINLPMIVADGQNVSLDVCPALSTTFLADYVLRQCGYYASPPVRANPMLSATMHGSGWPEVGALYSYHGANASPLGFIPGHDPGEVAKWVMAVATNGASNQEIRYTLDESGGTTGTNNGQEFFYEAWHKFTSAAVDQGMFQAFVTGGATEPQISAGFESGAGQFVLVVRRGGGEGATIRVLIGPTISPGTGWHYYAVHVAFTSTQIIANFRYDATTTGPVTQATASVTGVADIDTVRVNYGYMSSTSNTRLNGYTEAVQITREATAGTWNNAFVPTADVHASEGVYYQITATPPVSEEAWGLLQQLAEAEFHTAGFTEAGVAFWWPRDRWTTAPYTSSQRTLSAATSLKELATVEAVDQVRNKIIIRATQPEVLATADVWRATTRWSVPASGSRTLWAEFEGPVANVDTSVSYVAGVTVSRYHGSTVRDGQGTAVSNLTFVVTPFANSAKVVVTNPNAFTVWLVGNTGVANVVAGDPSFILAGQPVVFDQADPTVGTALRTEATDATSIADYEEQLLELEAGSFRQDIDQVEGLGVDLLVDLKQPGPVLTDVPIVGDSRLQLGDRVTIVDPDGLGFTADFHLSKCDLSFDEGGLSGVIGLRSA